MSEEFGPTFITVTDEDDQEIELEYIDTLELNGIRYFAFFPAETDDTEEDPDNGLVILKAIEENGEDIFSTLDDDAEMDAVYDAFMETLFNEDEDGTET